MLYVIIAYVQVYKISTLFKYFVIYIDRLYVRNHNNTVDFLSFYANNAQ